MRPIPESSSDSCKVVASRMRCCLSSCTPVLLLDLELEDVLSTESTPEPWVTDDVLNEITAKTLLTSLDDWPTKDPASLPTFDNKPVLTEVHIIALAGEDATAKSWALGACSVGGGCIGLAGEAVSD